MQLVSRPSEPSVHKRRKVILQFGIRSQYWENVFILTAEKLNSVRKGTVFSSLENAEIPNDSGKEYDWRLHKEISLFLHPRLVEVEHDGVRRLVGI